MKIIGQYKNLTIADVGPHIDFYHNIKKQWLSHMEPGGDHSETIAEIGKLVVGLIKAAEDSRRNFEAVLKL